MFHFLQCSVECSGEPEPVLLERTAAQSVMRVLRCLVKSSGMSQPVSLVLLQCAAVPVEWVVQHSAGRVGVSLLECVAAPSGTWVGLRV